MKNLISENDRELLDLLQSQDTQTPAEDWSAMLSDIRSHDDVSPGAEFEDNVRERWQAELAAAERKSTPRRQWPRLAWPLVAAAAVVAFVLLWPGTMPTPNGGRSSSSGVAWGDVVRAMQEIQQFQMLVFDDSPNTEGRSPITRFDLFYQHPDRWRAQAMGQVIFTKAGDPPRIWSVAKGGWLGPKEPHEDILPTDFIEKHQKLGTLNAVLAMFFGGDVPKGSPVKSDEVAAAQGIDVFDHAKDASKQWVRIWVLRESKLPLKMHFYMPESDNFLLISFDYSDPQPPAFFDAEVFGAAAAKIQGDDAQRIFRIGSKPIAGTQPRGSDQIYEVKGYEAPKVMSVSSNKAGDVMIVTEDLENTTPAGVRPHFEGFRKITDNWGNTFIPAGWHRQVGKNTRWLYMPQPPLKKGDAPRKISFTYAIEPTYGDLPIKLADQTLDVPATKPGDKADPGWPKDFEKEKETWYRNYLQSNGSLAQQLAEVERRLDRNPQDVEALVWQHQLLRRYGRVDAAAEFFEKHLRDRALADPDVLEHCTTPMSQYLLHLAANNRETEMRQISEQINRTIDKLTKSPEAGNRWKHSALTEKVHDPLYRTTHLLEWREKYKDGPTIVRTLASKDGYVFVELEIPEPPLRGQGAGWDGGGHMTGTWFWDTRPTNEGWVTQANGMDLPKRRQKLVFRGSGKQITLGGSAVLQADNYHIANSKNDFKVTWQRTIDVPAASIDAMQAWFQKETGGGASWFPPAAASQPAAAANAVQALLDEGDKLRHAGQFEEALKRYEQVLAAPSEQWPDTYRAGVALDPDLVEGRKRSVRIARATCLAGLKRFDDARAEAAKIRSALPAAPDLNDPLHAMITADAMLADLEVAKGLLAAGDAAAADAELKRIAAARPNVEDVNEGAVMIPRGSASFGWNARHFQTDTWRKFDTVWWRVHDALANAK